MTLMMISAQVVETSVNVTNNSPSRDYSHPDDQTTQTIIIAEKVICIDFVRVSNVQPYDSMQSYFYLFQKKFLGTVKNTLNARK